MAKLSPQETAEKHARNLKGATQYIQAGVARVDTAPGVLAAKKKDKMQRNLNKALDSGKWERRVASVSLPDWKKAMTEKGIPRISAGVDASLPKTADFFGQLFQHQDVIAGELENMADVTLEDGINKAIHNMRRMADFKRE